MYHMSLPFYVTHAFVDLLVRLAADSVVKYLRIIIM
jgi:hypothetical protein